MMRTSSPGDQIEHYTIARKLTEGGMAEVYLAHEPMAGSRRPVVLKSLLPGFVDNKEYVAMMLNEARIARRLSHPNIVRVDDLIEAGGRPFIVMEYLEGQNLRQIVHRALKAHRTLSLGFVCGVVVKMLEGLQHAHDLADAEGRPLGLVHRDVSLANVIVTWSGRVALIDFGIAKATTMVNEELTQAGQVKGKSSYMSPEQIRREPLDRRSDLFSVGIALWEMLTQRRLFARRTEVDSMMAICCQDAAPPSSLAPELPPALDRICARALARERAVRYQSASDMKAELEAVIAAEKLRAADSELAAELATLFPEESREARKAAMVALPSLFDDTAEEDDDHPTTMAPPRRLMGDDGPTPRTPTRTVRDLSGPIRLASVATSTLRSTDLSLFNQRIPGPSVYDDFFRDGRVPFSRRPISGPLALFLCCLCLLVVAVVFQLWQGVGL